MVPEGWRKQTLGDITSASAFGPRFSSDLYVEDGAVGTIRTTDLDGEGNIDYRTIPYANLPSSFRSHYLQDGDLLITRSGSCGIPCIFRQQRKPVVAGAFLIRFVLNDDVLPSFIHAFLKSSNIQRKINNLASGGVQKNLSGTNLKKLELCIPPFKEQQKIAQILSTWDKAIATTEQLLAKSEQQKKALMQQLLTGKKRLPGFGRPGTGGFSRKGIPDGWSYERIGNVAEEVADRNKEHEELPVLSCSKYDGFVDSLKYFKKKVYSDDTSNYKLIRCGEFGFPANHVEEGSIGLQSTHDKGIVSPIYVVFRVDPGRVDEFFLYKVLKTDHYRQVFAASTSASVDRRGSLRWKQFSSINVPLPILKEQKSISRVIRLAEQEEKVLEQSLNRLHSEKKALMQQLLTGQRRVKLSEKEMG